MILIIKSGPVKCQVQIALGTFPENGVGGMGGCFNQTTAHGNSVNPTELRWVERIWGWMNSLCIPSQNFCVLSQIHLHSLAKPVEFGQTLPVYFIACSCS